MRIPWARILPLVTRVLLIVALLGGSYLVFEALVASRPEVRRNEPGSGAAYRRVVTMPAPRLDVRRSWRGYGTARAMDQARVAAEVSGLVADMPPEIEAGRAVRAGEVLARLESDDYEAAVEVARQTVRTLDAQIEGLDVQERTLRRQLELAEEETAVARRDLERLERTIERGGANPLELDRQRRLLNQAERTETQIHEQVDLLEPRRGELEARRALEQARLDQARTNLARTVIRSPMDGILQEVAVERGERVNPGAAIARIVSLGRIEVPLRFPVSAQSWIDVGDEVVVSADVASGRSWTAEVRRIAPEHDAATRTMLLYAEHEQDAEGRRLTDLLRPGLFVTGVARSQVPESRLAVPRRALVDGRVLVVVEGTIEPRPVEIDYYVSMRPEGVAVPDTEWAVLDESGSALRVGETLVLTNIDELDAGMPVTAVGASSLPRAANSATTAASPSEGGG